MLNLFLFYIKKLIVAFFFLRILLSMYHNSVNSFSGGGEKMHRHGKARHGIARWKARRAIHPSTERAGGAGGRWARHPMCAHVVVCNARPHHPPLRLCPLSRL